MCNSGQLRQAVQEGAAGTSALGRSATSPAAPPPRSPAATRRPRHYPTTPDRYSPKHIILHTYKKDHNPLNSRGQHFTRIHILFLFYYLIHVYYKYIVVSYRNFELLFYKITHLRLLGNRVNNPLTRRQSFIRICKDRK